MTSGTVGSRLRIFVSNTNITASYLAVMSQNNGHWFPKVGCFDRPWKIACTFRKGWLVCCLNSPGEYDDRDEISQQSYDDCGGNQDPLQWRTNTTWNMQWNLGPADFMSASQLSQGALQDVDEELRGMFEFASVVRNNHNWPLTWKQYRSDVKVSSSIIPASVATPSVVGSDSDQDSIRNDTSESNQLVMNNVCITIIS